MRYILTVIYLLCVVLWALFALISSALLVLLTALWDKERRIFHTYTRFLVWVPLFMAPLWRMRVDGLENIDRNKAYIITANHQSFLDIPTMLYFIGLNFKFVSKWEVFRIPVIGQLLALRDDIVIRRGRSSATTTLLEKGAKHLSAGTSITIFPEGTRSKDRQVHKFKSGAFHLAHDNKVAILPCVIDGSATAFSWSKGMFRNTFRLRVLPPIEADEVVATTPNDMATRVEALTRTELEKLRAEKK